MAYQDYNGTSKYLNPILHITGNTIMIKIILGKLRGIRFRYN
jgi:hypothetical protein